MSKGNRKAPYYCQSCASRWKEVETQCKKAETAFNASNRELKEADSALVKASNNFTAFTDAQKRNASFKKFAKERQELGQTKEQVQSNFDSDVENTNPVILAIFECTRKV